MKLSIVIGGLYILMLQSCEPSSTKNNCVDLKREAFNLNAQNADELKAQLYKLLDCGFDSVDCEMAAPLIATLLNKSINNNSAVTYGEIVEMIDHFKKDSSWMKLRSEYIEIEKRKPKPPH